MLGSYRGDKPVIASRNAFGRGLNLQHFGACVFSGPLSDSIGIEQAIGRIHRSGQAREEVFAYFYSHLVHGDALLKAVKSAKVIGTITKQKQKILKLDEDPQRGRNEDGQGEDDPQP